MALDAETEIERRPLQIGMVDEVSKSVGSPKPSMLYTLQWFIYLGQCDDEGHVDPMSAADGEDQFPTLDESGLAYVTIGGERQYLDFVGQQIAGYYAQEVAAVPEPCHLAAHARRCGRPRGLEAALGLMRGTTATAHPRDPAR